ncbi:hypothetical protein ACFX1R_035816 [Malus domestica]
MGFALCALFVAGQNISASTSGLDSLLSGTHGIFCRYSFGSNNTFPDSGRTIASSLGEAASDHLWLVGLSRKFLLEVTSRREKLCDQIQFRFETVNDFGSKTCLKVKKCGVCPVYEQDTEEEIN